MNNKIKKINLNHSFIFFFVVNIFCILLFKINNKQINGDTVKLLVTKVIKEKMLQNKKKINE